MLGRDILELDLDFGCELLMKSIEIYCSHRLYRLTSSKLSIHKGAACGWRLSAEVEFVQAVRSID